MNTKALSDSNYYDLWVMKVVITSATTHEAYNIKQNICQTSLNDLKVSFHISGLGILSTCYSLTKMIFEQKPDIIIQVGIAGSFDKTIALGKVFAVKEECVGDIGVEENGLFNDVFDMKLEDENAFPYAGRKLTNPWLSKYNFLQLDEVDGVTINEISTRPERIRQLKSKYSPVIESMEGAALHYVGLQMQVPFIQIRAVSNYVGARDKSKWNFNEALENLGDTVLRYTYALQSGKL
ncbi:MAG: futalosine hydrolase [Segetibacter sp.]